MLSQLSSSSLASSSAYSSYINSKSSDHLPETDYQEYGQEMLDWLLKIEKRRTIPDPKYFDLQPEINWKMRRTLFLWLIQVNQEFGLQTDTLYLTFNLIDRIGTRVQIGQRQYQLVGLTCLWIASKSEENHGKTPNIKKLMYMCCHTYRELDFIQMERFILIELKFYLGHVSSYQFMQIYSKMWMISPDSKIAGVSKYLIELASLNRKCLGVLPSAIAKSCLHLAYLIVEGKQLPNLNTTENMTLKLIYECLRSPPNSLVKKFTSREYGQASLIVQRYNDDSISKQYVIQNGLLTPPKDEGMKSEFQFDPAVGYSVGFGYRKWVPGVTEGHPIFGWN